MIITVDTNVLISGIFWSGPPSQILDLWEKKKFSLALTPNIIEEYYSVVELMQKKMKSKTGTSVLDLIVANSKIYEPLILKKSISRDPDDDKFIACALSSKSDYLVSGDKDLLVLHPYKKLPILKPAEFLKAL